MPIQRWLMKSEPDVFSIDHLAKVGCEPWSGVRSFQARNFMDQMKVGDRVLFYHSSAQPSGVAGVGEVAREAYPDHTAWQPGGDYVDAKSTPEKPLWRMVDVRFVAKLPRLVPLEELKAIPELAGMMLFSHSRLSVQPVDPLHFDVILRLAARPPHVAAAAAKPAAATSRPKAKLTKPKPAKLKPVKPKPAKRNPVKAKPKARGNAKSATRRAR